MQVNGDDDDDDYDYDDERTCQLNANILTEALSSVLSIQVVFNLGAF